MCLKAAREGEEQFLIGSTYVFGTMATFGQTQGYSLNLGIPDDHSDTFPFSESGK